VSEASLFASRSSETSVFPNEPHYSFNQASPYQLASSRSLAFGLRVRLLPRSQPDH
jgi:hypothetical protein